MVAARCCREKVYIHLIQTKKRKKKKSAREKEEDKEEKTVLISW